MVGRLLVMRQFVTSDGHVGRAAHILHPDISMTRFFLVLLALLVGLLGASRVAQFRARARVQPVTIRAARPPVESAPPIAATIPVEESRTPAIDLLARLEGRRRLLRSSSFTYFDSLFTETDSVVRRWPDREGTPFAVALPNSESQAGQARLLPVLRRALSAWEETDARLRFTLTADTTGAEIVVHSIPELGGDRAGQTDLQWSHDGAIHSAVITMAINAPGGSPLPELALFAVALHEVGHALGLGHSPSPDDVMFSAASRQVLSARDRATITLLYELPLGTVREVVTK
jgi:hypothetical protein